MPLLPIFAPIYQHQSARETELATVRDWPRRHRTGLGAPAPDAADQVSPLRDGPVRESEGTNGRGTAVWPDKVLRICNSSLGLCEVRANSRPQFRIGTEARMLNESPRY